MQSLVQRMSHELNAKAVVVLHENGQVLHRSGWIEDHDFPSMAALVAAMIAAGKSIGNLGDEFLGSPSRFSCDSDAMGLYIVAVTTDLWLAVLYDQPLNPGLFRMKVRRHSETIARLGIKKPDQWELPQNGTSSGANLPPVSSQTTPSKELITPVKPTLFGDISDEEIDELFENARS